MKIYPSLIRPQIWLFHVVVLQTTAKKWTKTKHARAQRAKLLFLSTSYVYYTLRSPSVFSLAKSLQLILGNSATYRLFAVGCARNAWFPRAMCLKNTVIAAIMRLSLFSSKQCIIKQLLDSVFVISGIIKVSVSVISLSLRLRLITLTSTLIIPDITKTSSNNCLKFATFSLPSLFSFLKFWVIRAKLD